ncbi:uncharacterized protein LOC34620332 [Cyclospora cayetanensis]|uniref:Uncharacterized protein LOC34620332 n=1 Tax=Cyclospora cayetanensis TaxID=88456 RepID=A0A6P6RR10_9EIME|nr:uncharacterized protein LOC34620332 [Cyclospora cayetanensis]
MGTQHSVLPVILDLRIKARELKRQSDRCYRESLQEREKIRRALLRHNQEGARVFAQNYVRKQHEGLNCLHMSSKLEAVASRLDGAHRSHQLTTKIHSVASGLSGALRKLDSSASLREIELFSKLFDDLDVRSDSVSSLLDASTSSAMPTQQVDKVLLEVAQAYRIPLEDHAEAADALVATHKEQMSRQQVGSLGKDYSCVYTARAGKCFRGKAERLCRLTPLGTWQGKPTYDPYEALGVAPNAPLKSIQRAYRVKARVCHPDKLRAFCAKETGVHEGEKEAHEEPFVIINAAYEMLRNETHRKLFDRRGSGDGGRFVRRGHNTGILGRTAAAATTVLDMMNLFAQGYSFGSKDSDEDEELDEEELDDDDEDEDPFSAFDLFGMTGEEEDTPVGQSDSGFAFEWDLFDMASII